MIRTCSSASVSVLWSLGFLSLVIYILPNIKILTAQEGNIGNCHHEKITVDRGDHEAEVDSGFEGWQFPMLPSSAVNKLLYCTEC